LTSYRSAVREAKSLLRRTEEDQWRLAELSWEQVTQRGYSAVSWGRDIGISSQHGGRLVRLWALHRDAPQRPSYTEAYAALNSQPINSITRLREAPQEKRAEVVHDLFAADPGLERAVRALDPPPFRSYRGTGLTDDAENAAALNRRTLSDTDEAVDYLRGAARELAHAFAARDREGVQDEQAEKQAIEEVTRALSMYVAAVNGTTTVTDADRFWLEQVGVTL
jgi:hypothetical protein